VIVRDREGKRKRECNGSNWRDQIGGLAGKFMSYFFQKLGSGTKGGEDESRRRCGKKKVGRGEKGTSEI
jgi:hypothetical protein